MKDRAGRVLAAVDGGMSDNIRPALYGARHTVALASPAPDRPLRTVDVVGKHCESGDVVARGCELPEPRPGDLLAVAATGGYCYSLASNYNRLGGRRWSPCGTERRRRGCGARRSTTSAPSRSAEPTLASSSPARTRSG